MTKRKAPPISDAEEARVQAMIARDPDNPDVTPEEAAQARPASEALDPELFARLTRRGRPKSEASKVLVTLRLPPAVVAGYRATGPGWQVRMGEVLSAGLEPESATAEAERAGVPGEGGPEFSGPRARGTHPAARSRPTRKSA